MSFWDAFKRKGGEPRLEDPHGLRAAAAEREIARLAIKPRAKEEPADPFK
jgi:hypothetical protein